ncbi:MAG TPA: N-acetylneuraminate synthase [Bacillales bacterium]|nr:N-acetylneuraminate synthase [Bacillales bacterium]
MGVYIIAEAGVNHNGSMKLAKQLIDIAAEAGADAVKFQTFKADELVSQTAPKAEYQKNTTEEKESQYEMLKKLELTEEDHSELIHYCLDKRIQFLSTPFDLDSVDLLVSFSLPFIKVSSGDLTNAPLLLKIARTGCKVILSTGMSSLNEIGKALEVMAFGYLDPSTDPSQHNFEVAFASRKGQNILKEKVTLLHCTTEYPAPFSEVNLKAMDTLKETFGLSVGFSDHTSGITVPIAAAARGAAVLEKHFTVDRGLPGPDHKASLEPDELTNMVKAIRDAELALGTHTKEMTPSEIKNAPIARKSLVARKKIKRGECFSIENLTVKRPGTGLSPREYWNLLGSKAKKNYEKDEVIR